MTLDYGIKTSRTRIWIARSVAIAADILEIVIFPAFIEGFASPFDATVDIVVCALLTMLVGWHIAFLPSFIVKALPFADLAPTWTLAIFIATGGKGKSVPEDKLLTK